MQRQLEMSMRLGFTVSSSQAHPIDRKHVKSHAERVACRGR